ncbi:hypothetical protein SARC_11443 [Sphaeroforma arctica JP610]|uniref:Uncharacterized protein n=1 Tax=Sphaeroforma arctica JP610 TaxID=667725 RepID=A0A0L0FH02_9EUKA|nr:hypothetical protein SARC_11443 [Sphaeroforma arctica JP610]KNC76047.1 hypothetical protein SARC_11443 [Sphaeroforma arctica JP610]|eukprot:XP_014149949.1 hypothetical protein SARC_11443 [Sphaeroforma arctica JP610]
MNAKMGKSRPSIQMSENAGYPSIQNKGEVNVHANAHVQTLQAHARTISVDDNMIRLHNERVRNGDTDDGQDN